MTLVSTGPRLAADLARLRSSFGTVDTIEHEKKIPVPGSANGIDLRAQDPNGPYGRTMLRLDSGRWPRGPNEIALAAPGHATWRATGPAPARLWPRLDWPSASPPWSP